MFYLLEFIILLKSHLVSGKNPTDISGTWVQVGVGA